MSREGKAAGLMFFITFQVKFADACGLCGVKFINLGRSKRKTRDEEWLAVNHVLHCKSERSALERKKFSTKQCLVCKRIVASNKSLRVHSLLHVLPRDKLYCDDHSIECRLTCDSCPGLCKSTFKTRRDLADHIENVHVGQETIGMKYHPMNPECKLN